MTRVTRKMALVIIPTYNEAKNIGPLLDQLFALSELNDMGWQLDALVMDDTSPDGTSDIVRKLAETTYKNRVFLHTGKKEGLGRALQKSFDAALTYKHDVFLTMDADFSHSPRDIPELLRAIDEGADIAVGSRYIDGGLIPGNWPLALIIRTRIATAVARWLGGVSDELSELTTNFRAMRRTVLQQIPYNDVKANGYGIQIFLANAFSSGKYRLTEVPITFRSRAHGASKARFKDVAEFFKVAYQLNPDSPAKQAMRFVIVGISGTIINLTTLWQLQELTGTTAPYVSFAAIQVSIFWNFLLHSTFTFKAHREMSRHNMSVSYIRNFAKYECASLFSQSIMLSMYTALTWAGVYYLLAQLLGIATAFVANYYLSAKYIWTHTKPHVR